ncbi:TetR/AcrR family transcriptional regulator [Kytococcus sp. Marseille-QA3725]
MSLREAHKKRTRAALVAAAGELVDDRGIAELTPDAVAERAGVSRRTLFNYFGSAEECLLQPVHAVMETLVAEFQRFPADLPPVGRPAQRAAPGVRRGALRPHGPHLVRPGGQSGAPAG